MKPFKLSPEEVKKVVDKIVPIIAVPKDYDFFRASISLMGENLNSSQFAVFINNLLKKYNK
jgi:hypothetical protein